MYYLNEEQKKAVDHIDGPSLILAGAGTGKTRTLVARIANILNNNHALPHEIMAVTFTNKAAKEMQERILELTNIPIGRWVGTFHSIAAKILRENADHIGLTSNFIIIDQNDQLNLVKNIMSDISPEYVNDGNWRKKIKIIVNTIQRWKDKGINPDKVLEVRSEIQKVALECYVLYQERLKLSNAADFDDLILHNINIFNQRPEVLHQYQQKIKFIMVDEYQDTNTIQYIWLRLLAQKHKNICCVGDDDQSIYSWRGAEISNILRFSDDFIGAKVIKLERNYRSTAHILAVASSVISENNDRLGKNLWTDNDSSTKVKLMRCYNHKEEARNIINLIMQQGEYSNTAILVRASAQTRPLEECCAYYQLPYSIIGGLRFYDRKEIKDAISYLKIAINLNDDIAFERIVNVPKRGIGPSTIKKIYYAALSSKTSLVQSAQSLIDQNIIKNEKLKQLFIQLHEWHELALSPGMSCAELMEIILKSSGYMEMLTQDNDIEALSKKENIKELLHAMRDFSDMVQFLEHIMLVTTSDNSVSGVNIMTLHAAKGLEFDNVFLPGWEEEIFPHQRSIKEGKVEEERRLAYVGITRAKKNLCISFAQSRFINNCWLNYPPSRFLNKMSKENIDISNVY